MIYSVNLLQKAENLALAYGGDSGYYLAFSAGKDSQALYHIAELAGVKFDAHMNLTSVDPPEVIRFVKQSYPEVDLIKPKKSIYQHAIEKQILPTMRVRWCCAEYKENAGAGRVTLIGIRHQESSRRAKRNEVEVLKWAKVVMLILHEMVELAVFPIAGAAFSHQKSNVTGASLQLRGTKRKGSTLRR